MEQKTESTRIAFVDVLLFDDGSVRGGVLVTDTLSRPYEFRVTSIVKPSQLQKILYGQSLVDYMYGEVICLPLLKQMKESVSLTICKDEHLLVARPNLSFPMAYIEKPKKSNGKEDLATITLRTHKNFSGEQPQAEILLNLLMQNFDVYEPFDRLKLAVAEVHKQNIG